MNFEYHVNEYFWADVDHLGDWDVDGRILKWILKN
jgi:hypothetical protein